MPTGIRIFYENGWWKLEYTITGKVVIYLIQGKKKHTEKGAFKKAETRLDKVNPQWREG